MPVSKELEDQIKALLDQQLSCREIATKLGVGVQVVAGYQAAATRRSSSQSSELADALETTFGLERDLQKALRNNIEQLERGLKIIDGGKERKVESGFIDITAKDKNGNTVVIELKAGSADRETIGQIAGYMGDVQATDKSVSGAMFLHRNTNGRIVSSSASLEQKSSSFTAKKTCLPHSVFCSQRRTVSRGASV